MPVAWIDSGAASTTKELQPYLATLQGIVRISKRYLSPNPQSEGVGELIESLDQDSWTRLSSQFPAAIAEREPLEFDDFDGVSVEQLREIALSGD